MSYCTYCNALPIDHVDRIYHDTIYGRPCTDDRELFGRFILEINQAGLSWHTILNKSHSIRIAYANYNIEIVAGFNEKAIEKLLGNKGVIRHKGKIQAIVFNAQQILSLQEKYGSFYEWIKDKGEITLEEWIKVFKKKFKFVGKEIVSEFLKGSGFIEGAHEKSCPVFNKL
jgi:DNA-3-methyladenine glycosylase I